MSKKPNSAPVSLHKVIMVGSGGVGKSAVSMNWQKGIFWAFITHKKMSVCLYGADSADHGKTLLNFGTNLVKFLNNQPLDHSYT